MHKEIIFGPICLPLPALILDDEESKRRLLNIQVSLQGSALHDFLHPPVYLMLTDQTPPAQEECKMLFKAQEMISEIINFQGEKPSRLAVT